MMRVFALSSFFQPGWENPSRSPLIAFAFTRRWKQQLKENSQSKEKKTEGKGKGRGKNKFIYAFVYLLIFNLGTRVIPCDVRGPLYPPLHTSRGNIVGRLSSKKEKKATLLEEDEKKKPRRK